MIQALMSKKFLFFLLTGSINTIFFYFLYASLLYLSFNYLEAILIANFFGILFSYTMFSKHVFKEKEKNSIFTFYLMYGVLISVYTTLVFILKKIGLNDYLAGFFALLLNTPLSFFTNKHIVFKDRN